MATFNSNRQNHLSPQRNHLESSDGTYRRAEFNEWTLVPSPSRTLRKSPFSFDEFFQKSNLILDVWSWWLSEEFWDEFNSSRNINLLLVWPKHRCRTAFLQGIWLLSGFLQTMRSINMRNGYAHKDGWKMKFPLQQKEVADNAWTIRLASTYVAHANRSHWCI